MSATPLLHPYATAALRRRQNRVAAVPLAVMARHTGPRTVSAAPLSSADLAKFPNRQYSTPSSSPIIPKPGEGGRGGTQDRKSTRLNSSHGSISYAVFCL